MATSANDKSDKLTSPETDIILKIVQIHDKVEQRRAIENLLIYTKSRFKKRLIRNIEKFK